MPFRRKVRCVLVSEKYAGAFTGGKFKSSDFDLLLADNGNFTRLNLIADEFKPRALALDAAAETSLKTAGKLSVAILAERRKLNRAIISACMAAEKKMDLPRITRRQVAINPGAIIGAEDATIAILQICGAFNRAFRGAFPSLVRFQKNNLSLYRRQADGEFGSVDELRKTVKYLVVHAFDHDSMVSALKRLAGRAPPALAVSLGGCLGRKGFLVRVRLARKEIRFSEALPESYLSSVLLLLAVRNTAPRQARIHLLGLGSPILILLAGYMFRDFAEVTIDSTATYKDVEANYVYGDRAGLYKMDLFRLVAFCLANNTPYRPGTPCFRAMERKHPSDWKALRRIFGAVLGDITLDAAQKQRAIRDSLEADPAPLVKAVKMLAPIRSLKKEERREVRIARAYENYWVNHNLCRRMSSFRTKGDLTRFVLTEIDRFSRFGSPNYVQAVRESVRIIDAHPRC